MKSIFKLLKKTIILVIIILGIWNYQTNNNFRTATNNSWLILKNKLEQFWPANNSIKLKNQLSNYSATDNNLTNSKKVSWAKPKATVYLDIINNPTLKTAAINAIEAWNHTNCFTFNLINNKNQAQITINVIEDSSTNAAGETSTVYDPNKDRLVKATIHLNRFYLENKKYNYSNLRITNTVEHELGHAIGLKHNKGVSVMYPQGSYYTIQPLDIQNVKKLYHEK